MQSYSTLLTPFTSFTILLVTVLNTSQGMDVIESGLGKSAVIKSHHNVGGLPDYVDFKEIIEPLRLLFKDEVRERKGLYLSQLFHGCPRCSLPQKNPFSNPLCIRKYPLRNYAASSSLPAYALPPGETVRHWGYAMALS